jgi:ADP-heptose:LPS heptosyltransferase
MKKRWSLRDYYDRRQTVFIMRGTGGIGDILMHRMIFEDFKLLNPDIKVIFGCPPQFMSLIEGHPFVDEVVDFNNYDMSKLIIHYDTTTICGRIEAIASPYSAPHRSDIWANWCGLELTRHNMHMKISEPELAEAKELTQGAKVCFAPISAISSKNLTVEQIDQVCKGLQERGLSYYGIHSRAIPGFDGKVLHGKNNKQFMALVGAADYVISVDSAAFHIAGGLGIPMVGIFSWADGKVYGKYYEKWNLIQKHRDEGWDCGPCYNWGECHKCHHTQISKPCITELTAKEILQSLDDIMVKWPTAK